MSFKLEYDIKVCELKTDKLKNLETQEPMNSQIVYLCKGNAL